MVFLMLVLLAMEVAPPFMVLMGILIVFIPLQILDVNEAFHGFSDPGWRRKLQL